MRGLPGPRSTDSRPPMSRLPRPLKRALLPIWNGGHRLAWRLGEYVDAARHRRFERCAVCGHFGPMLYRPRVIPPELQRRWGLSPRLAAAVARKESCDCWRCGAKLRARRMARTILDLYPSAGAVLAGRLVALGVGPGPKDRRD